MGCGCSKNRLGVGGSPASRNANPSAVRKQSVVLHEVLDSNEDVVAQFTNPVSARAEARRIGGVVRSTTSPTKTPTGPGGDHQTDNAK